MVGEDRTTKQELKRVEVLGGVRPAELSAKGAAGILEASNRMASGVETIGREGDKRFAHGPAEIRRSNIAQSAPPQYRGACDNAGRGHPPTTDPTTGIGFQSCPGASLRRQGPARYCPQGGLRRSVFQSVRGNGALISH